ncbi:hypothetical protein SAMN05192546_101419 [Tindallia californiensis]|uniref:Phosphatidylglycerol lysyltransferase n=1 Tax=Tindallia californiensis TaxID=159292 RepID=A0A1H3J588_9FIRM|nr:hypothetical protein SAMN05192546_101419 [Tindallia californiensis]
MVLLLIWQTDIASVIDGFKGISKKTLLLLIFLQIITQLLIAYQWKRLAWSNYREVTIKQMLRMNMAGSFVESITPSVKIGGEAVKVWWFKERLRWTGEEAASLLMIQKSLSGLVFLGYTILLSSMYLMHFWTNISAKWAWNVSENQWKYLFYYAGLLIFICIIGTCAYRIIKKKHADRIKSIGKIADESKRHWLRMRTNKFEMAIQLMLASVIWLLYPLKMIMLTTDLGIEVRFWVAAAVVFIAYTVAMIPALPGSVGTFEGAMVVLLTIAGIDPSLALVLTLIFRTVTFWLVCLISGFMTGYFHIQEVRNRRIKAFSG